MNKIKVDFTNEDILTALYTLASVGASKSLNIDLAKLDAMPGEKLSLSAISLLAIAGAENEDERAFANACLSAS